MTLYRRLSVALSLALVLYCPTAAADGITGNVFLRVLMIRTASGTGTAFTIDVDGRQYLVTAKHVVSDLHLEDTIQIRKYNVTHQLTWADFRVKVFRCADEVDIAVLVPREQLTVSSSFDPPPVNVRPDFGQDAFFRWISVW